MARVTDWFPDLSNLIRFFTRFWMYLSGVMFSIERFVDNPSFMRAMELNPAYQVLDIARDVMLYHTEPSLESWGIFSAWAVGLFVFGFLYFWQGEANYGRQ